MLRKKVLLILFLLLTIHSLVIGQKKDDFYLIDTSNFNQLTQRERNLIDTTLEKFHTMKLDTHALQLISTMYMSMNDNDVWIEYSRFIEQKVEAFKKQYPDFYWEKKIGAKHNEAYYFGAQGQQKKSLDIYLETVAMAKQVNNEDLIVNGLVNLGSTYNSMGEVAKAIDVYFEAAEYLANSEKHFAIANLYNNMGLLFDGQKMYDKAFEYYFKGLESARKLPLRRTECYLYYNIGSLHEKKERWDSTFYYYHKGIAIAEEYQMVSYIGFGHRYLGRAFLKKGELDRAKKHLDLAVTIGKQKGDYYLLAPTFSLLADYFLQKQLYNDALDYANEAIHLSDILDSKVLRVSPLSIKAKAHEKMGSYKEALESYRESIRLRDTVLNSELKESVKINDIQLNFEKKRITDSVAFAKKEALKNSKISQKEAELKSQRWQNTLLFAGVGFSLLLLLLVYRGFVIKKKSNKEIIKQKKKADELRDLAEEQRFLVEAKNNEILDSINYAKRIQNAILPPMKTIQKHLPESFVYYKPKDIVAGDFYWMETQGDDVYLAACDCTGHGVPGAMVSVVCVNGLNRTVREYGVKDPGKILDKTRDLVMQEFEKSEDEVKDGMDIALISLKNYASTENRGDTEGQLGQDEKNSTNTQFLLRYSGANNPLWIIRKGADEVEEIKANKQPIGRFENTVDFTTHSLKLEKGDQIYLFSDGYVDQFGGENLPNGKVGGKKFKAKNFKKLLLSIKDKSMDQQQKIIDGTFEDWKGNLEQLDDVCVIGVRL